MYIIKDIKVRNCTQSTWKFVWKNTQSPVEMFVKLLKLMIPLAYVNVTHDFFNSIPHGILIYHETDARSLACSYSQCNKVGTEMWTL